MVESATDGSATRIDPSRTIQSREFPASTSVLFVNGVDTGVNSSRDEARLVADRIGSPVISIHAATGGIASDLATCVEEKFGFANRPPEASVARAVLADLERPGSTRDVHIFAHSRGALIVQRALEQVVRDLQKDGWSSERIERDVLSHVTVETFGGASIGMPRGVDCVNYVRARDSVANVFGQGTPSPRDRELLAGIAAGSGTLLGSLETAKIGWDEALRHPNGPVVALPSVDPGRDDGPLRDMLENHDFVSYLKSRRPFAATFDAWEKTASPRRTAIDPSDVRRNVERLANTGERLPEVTRLTEWNGRPTTGTFVDVDDDFVAQHVGRGSYVAFDLERHLGGVRPDEGRAMHVRANGLVSEASAEYALSRG